MNYSTPPFRNSLELQQVFSHVQQRIQDKLEDYAAYDFTQKQSRAFNVFFDLAQEFDALEDLLTLAVLIIHSMFKIHAEIYILDQKATLQRYGCSTGAKCVIPLMSTEDLPLTAGPFKHEGRYCIPIRGKKVDKELLPITPVGETLGVLALHPDKPLDAKYQLFFEKFTNRVGYQLHNRLLAFKHREHLEFIKSLVHDIGHNVIVPNMYFKLLFRQLDSKMKAMRTALGDLMETSMSSPILTQLDYIQHRMDEQYQEVYRHFQQTSLFLETLLRQSHFEKGRYVLHKSVVNLRERIITPQLERFKSRFDEKDITVLPFCGPDSEHETEAGEAMLVTADVGLISQVLANLFSNAVKYTRPHDEPSGGSTGGLPRKYLCCAVSRLEDHFGEGLDAAKISVITSGPPIQPEDAPRLFDPDFRGRDVGREYGTGHGLFFAREISLLHEGAAGYETHPLGNCFFVLLPCEQKLQH